jgi:hypothetical protein
VLDAIGTILTAAQSCGGACTCALDASSKVPSALGIDVELSSTMLIASGTGLMRSVDRDRSVGAVARALEVARRVARAGKETVRRPAPARHVSTCRAGRSLSATRGRARGRYRRTDRLTLEMPGRIAVASRRARVRPGGDSRAASLSQLTLSALRARGRPGSREGRRSRIGRADLGHALAVDNCVVRADGLPIGADLANVGESKVAVGRDGQRQRPGRGGLLGANPEVGGTLPGGVSPVPPEPLPAPVELPGPPEEPDVRGGGGLG